MFLGEIAKNTLAIRAAEAPHMKQEPFRLCVFNISSHSELLIMDLPAFAYSSRCLIVLEM